MYRAAPLLIVLACTLHALAPAAALSYPLCTSYGAEYVSAAPRLTGKFPYYSMIWSCTGCAPSLLLSAFVRLVYR